MSLKGMPRNHLTFTREETLPSMYMRSGVNTRGGVSVYVIQNEILLLIRRGGGGNRTYWVGNTGEILFDNESIWSARYQYSCFLSIASHTN